MRAEEIAHGLEVAQTSGYGMLFLTLTAGHSATGKLDEIYGAQEAAWKRLQGHREWREALRRLGSLGRITYREITYGQTTGWHPHRHICLVFERLVGEGQAGYLEAIVRRLWVWACGEEGLTADYYAGADIRVVRQGGAAGIGWYAGKVAAEMARGDLKDGRRGRFTSEQLLDIAGDGEAWAIERWREYDTAVFGRQMQTWSKGLRTLLGLHKERTNEELADAEVGGVTVGGVWVKGWWGLVVTGQLELALLAAEEGPDQLATFLAERAPPGEWWVESASPWTPGQRKRWPSQLGPVQRRGGVQPRSAAGTDPAEQRPLPPPVQPPLFSDH